MNGSRRSSSTESCTQLTTSAATPLTDDHKVQAAIHTGQNLLCHSSVEWQHSLDTIFTDSTCWSKGCLGNNLLSGRLFDCCDWLLFTFDDARAVDGGWYRSGCWRSRAAVSAAVKSSDDRTTASTVTTTAVHLPDDWLDRDTAGQHYQQQHPTTHGHNP